MEVLIWIIVGAAIIGAVFALASGGKAKDVVSGAATGGLMAGGCLLQMVLAALPVIGGIVVIGLLLRSCS